MKKSHFIFIILLIFTFGCAKETLKKDITQKPMLHPPLRFLILGDSLIGGFFGVMLAYELERNPGISTKRFYHKSTGLSEYHRYNWPVRTVTYIKRFRSDILVVLFGANDSYAVRLKSGKLHFHWQNGFKELYAGRVRAYIRNALRYVKKIYWIGQPATNHRSFGPRYVMLNKIYREECEKVPGASYIPAWKWTSINGIYTPVMTDKRGVTGYVKFRGDRIHHSRFGGRVLAEKFIDFIRKDINFNP